MPIIIARKSLVYGNRRRHPGDEFDARKKDADVLVAIGKAKRKAGDPVVQLTSLRALELEAPEGQDETEAADSATQEQTEVETDAAEVAGPVSEKPKRQYKRRDLTTES